MATDGVRPIVEGDEESHHFREDHMSTHTASGPARATPVGRERGKGNGGPLAAVVVLLLAFAVGALVIAADRRRAGGGRGPRRRQLRVRLRRPAHDHSAHAATTDRCLPLQSFAGSHAPNAEASRRRTPPTTRPCRPCRRRPREGADDAEGHGRRGRARREVQHLGLRRPRRARARSSTSARGRPSR